MAEIPVATTLVLVEKVLSFLGEGAKLQKNLDKEIRDIRAKLRSAQAYLSDFDGREGSNVLKDRVNQVRDLAYDMEDALDEFMLCVPKHFHRHRVSQILSKIYHSVKDLPAFHEMSSKMTDIKSRMENLDPFRTGNINLEEGSSSGARVEDQASHQILEENDIVGFEKDKTNLIHQLENQESRRLNISVVGSGGSGKSILVKYVYESKEVQGKFDCHAWILVSRCSFNVDKHLWSMLNQFCVRSKESIPPGVDVGEKLRNYLQKKRYVVVLDDVWRPEDWERIVNALPNNGGSRIIVTTRNSDLASSCVESPHYIHELNGLSWKDAWKLFRRNAFPTSDGQCPEELVKLSQQIVKRCEGLPLAIVAVGRLLSYRRQIPIEWQKFHDSLGSDVSIISTIWMPSYKDLSINLKSCFLYFSIFPVDYCIKRGRLIRLWVAEGFVKGRRGKTLEEVAEDYLNELIGRNLVDASARDFDGRVSSCRVQNLVREFIILKSEEEKFVSILTEPQQSLSEQVRRLSIHYACTRLQIRDLPRVRTSFMFEWDDSFGSKIGKLLEDFKLLRVLDLQGAPLKNFPKEIIKLILLRYLSLRQTNIKTIPASIEKLAYLETLDLKQTYVTKLPEAIFRLQFLRHLLVYRYNVEKYVTYDSVQGVEVSAEICTLSAIQKLTLIKVNNHRTIIKRLGDLKQLRKLGLVGLKSEDGKNLCASIQKMQNLSTLDVSSTRQTEFLYLDEMVSPPRYLQRLYLKGRLQKLPGWISSLDSLVRIGLKWSKLEANASPLEVLQALPNLMELEMVDYYTGKALEFKATKFQKLKILYLEQFDQLNTVVVEQGAMPELEKLTICKCENLKILPLGIEYLTKLEELLLYDMHKDFISRLEKIESNEDRSTVAHIRVIHSFSSVGSSQSFSFQNLS